MARKKKKEKEEKQVVQSDFGHEIWGLIFLALGVLMIISLFSHFLNNSSNVLGYYFGSCLSLGLIWVFGVVPSLFFPLGIIAFGWMRLRGETLRLRTFSFWVIVILELCVLLSIHHLPAVNSELSFRPLENMTGFIIIRSLFSPIFGVYQFGPYFIVLLALTVTTLAIFHISPQLLIEWIHNVLKKVVEAIGTAFERIKMRWAEDRLISEEVAQRKREQRLLKQKDCKKIPDDSDDLNKAKTKAKVAKDNVSGGFLKSSQSVIDQSLVESSDSLPKIEASAIAAVGSVAKVDSDNDLGSIEDEARNRLDSELAAFRAKKKEPLKIMTIETTEVETEDSEEDNDAIVDIEVADTPALTGRVPDESEFNEDGSRKTEAVVIKKPYRLPDPSILPDPPPLSGQVDKDGIERNSMILETTLMNFGVEGKVVFVSPGPVVTRYEIELAPGIKVSRVLSLHDDISMAVNGQRIRIEAPIPGKSAVGIELPNAERQFVHFKHILQSDAFKKTKAKLPVIIGTNISGAPYVTDIAKMPHVLIAGQTGSGKSVCINSLICSLLMTMTPEELRLIMIDPKKVELAFYEHIPHLLSPVVTESKEAVKALQWGVVEMERRYRMLAKMGARNIDSFNTRVQTGNLKGILPDEDNKPLPFIVIIVDELADLMMTASKDVEGLIQRIAQLARAVGIHLIVATQRPSVDIITGPIKANLTSRIGFRTIQSTDSRTILGHVGAEKLLGMGDMLFLRNGAPEIERFHGSFITEEDVEKIVADIREQKYEIKKIERFLDDDDDGSSDGGSFTPGDRDELFEEAATIIVSIGQGSTSLLQRRMKIGYARAGRLMDEIERAGFVGPPDGSKAREVLVRPDELDDYLDRIR